jgi:two-component system repressor protein LuxO
LNGGGNSEIEGAQMKRILLIEDLTSLAHVYSGFLSKAGYDVVHVETGSDALDYASRSEFDGFVVDLGLPDIDGADLIAGLSDAGVNPAFIVVTADASISRAVAAVRSGAHDYLVKPIAQTRLTESIGQAIEAAKSSSRAAQLPMSNNANDCDSCAFTDHTKFVGQSEVMQAVYQTLNQVSRSKASVFITGESGTGKEVCAEAIHQLSPRCSKPFVAINCGAIPKELLESEIFGHLRGAFTGAVSDREGAALQANSGTLFLDEICELDLNLQTKLLRFLQTGIVQRIGSSSSEEVDTRIICATNKNPHQEVLNGRFREDLYYRLHVLPVHMPPLRDRGDDILLLAEYFLNMYGTEEARRFSGFDAAALHTIAGYDWPGNVRELQNIVRQIVVLHEGGQVSQDMLPDVISTPLNGHQNFAGTRHKRPSGFEDSDQHKADIPHDAGGIFGQELWRIEQAAINCAISACGGSVPKAAKVLGISPSTIYRKRENWPEMDSRVA